MHSERNMKGSNLEMQGSVRLNEIPIECGSKTPQSRSISGIRNFLAGGVGGAFGITLGHPLDTIKVRLQTAPMPKPGELPLFKGTLDCVLKTLRNEGIVGLFKGLLTPVALSTPLCALHFWAVTMGRRLQMAEPYGVPTHLQNFKAGMFAGVCGAILVIPCDRIKCLLQVQQSFGGEKTLKGPLDCANKLYREGGIRSLYKGTCATLLRDVPGMGLYFLSYESILDKLTLQGESRENLNPLRVIIAGGTAGMICWFSILPLDVLKSRVQTAPEGTYPKGTKDALRKLVKEERITSLYKGLTPVMIRAFIGNAGVFLGFEVTLKLFNWILPE